MSIFFYVYSFCFVMNRRWYIPEIFFPGMSIFRYHIRFLIHFVIYFEVISSWNTLHHLIPIVLLTWFSFFVLLLSLLFICLKFYCLTSLSLIIHLPTTHPLSITLTFFLPSIHFSHKHKLIVLDEIMLQFLLHEINGKRILIWLWRQR